MFCKLYVVTAEKAEFMSVPIMMNPSLSVGKGSV